MTNDKSIGGIGRRTVLQSLGTAGLSALVADAASAADDTNGTRLDAEVTTVEKPTRIREYPTYDADGTQTGSATWRVVRGTGNCCENYLAGAPDGAIYDAGGMYVFETPDDGETWRRVAPSTAVATDRGRCRLGRAQRRRGSRRLESVLRRPSGGVQVRRRRRRVVLQRGAAQDAVLRPRTDENTVLAADTSS